MIFLQTEIVEGWGFKVEEFTVKTKDDYILSVIKLYDTVTQKIPLVFGHAEQQNALRFVMRDNKSLGKKKCSIILTKYDLYLSSSAHYFGKMGFEIYLINFRGSKYSKMHAKTTFKDVHFWQFR